MIYILIIAVIIVIIVANKGKSSSCSSDAVRLETFKKIKASECAQAFEETLVAAFSPGGEQYQWMLIDNEHRSFQICFEKKGVMLKYYDFNRRNKDSGYTVNQEGWCFGASGYADLPDSTHVSAFRSHIIQQIKERCPNIEFYDNNNYVRLRKSALKQW